MTNDHRTINSNPEIFKNIGNTPLVPITIDQGNKIWCKLEFFNPTGSVKDRIAKNILLTAWRSGKINENTTVIEASSGSTSIALALACSHMGLKFKAVLPRGASKERQWTIMASGGEVFPTSEEEGMKGAMDKALELAKDENVFFADQFNNSNNYKAHETTAAEILRALPRESLDILVCGVGTGGTLVGIYKYCVDRHYQIKPYVARLKPGAEILHDIGFTPPKFNCLFQQELDKNNDFSNAVEIIEVEESTAIKWTNELWEKGFPVGPASGVNFAAAVEVAKKVQDQKNKNIITVFTDRMERYFSTEIFNAIKLKSAKRMKEQEKEELKEELKKEILEELLNKTKKKV